MEYIKLSVLQEDIAIFLNTVEDVFRQIRQTEFSDDRYSVITVLPPISIHAAKCTVVLGCHFDKGGPEWLQENLDLAHRKCCKNQHDWSQVGDCPAGKWENVCTKCGEKA